MGHVCPSWLSFILYNPVRKIFTDREKILKESGIGSETVVLEVGAGNGFFTEVLARRSRKVYAVELQDGMIRKLRTRTGLFGQKVTVIQGDIAALILEEALADVCLLYYSFHEVGDKQDAAENIGRAVRTGGILSIYEPTIEVGNTDMLATTSLFEQRGFSKEQVRNGFFTRFVRLRKSTGRPS